MTTYVLLRIDDFDEARDLLNDLREYPDDPLLTPVQENAVHVTVQWADDA